MTAIGRYGSSEPGTVGSQDDADEDSGEQGERAGITSRHSRPVGAADDTARPRVPVAVRVGGGQGEELLRLADPEPEPERRRQRAVTGWPRRSP